MIPTLQIGDYIFVNKMSYGYSKHSFDFSFSVFGYDFFSFGPVPIEGRVWGETPKRGDVVVFKLPSNPRIDYIKRVIGLPGDRIQMRHGVVYLNGAPVPQKPLESYYGDVGREMAGPTTARRYEETLPNGVHYTVLDLAADDILDNTEEVVVPPGHYFMMGDNRDNSGDSRTTAVGFVPDANIIGKAKIVFFSSDPRQTFAIRFGRFFTWIQ